MNFGTRRPRRRRPDDAGFTYIELMVAASLMFVSLLALAGMFVAGFAHVNGAGNATMGLASARQVLEDARRLPFDNLVNLNGFNTDDVTSLPASDPEREVARRWRYALAGEGVGWSFTDEEQARWPSLVDVGNSLGGVGNLRVVQQTATLTAITVEITVPGTWRRVEISTVIAKL